MIALDTNILVYAGQSEPDHRKERAIEIVAAVAVVDSFLPTQALVEFSAVCRSKRLLDLAACEKRVIEWSEGFRTIGILPEDVVRALSTVDRHKLSFYDALICATARRGGATTLLSEDMADGENYDGVRIVNPFDPANEAVIAHLLT